MKKKIIRLINYELEFKNIKKIDEFFFDDIYSYCNILSNSDKETYFSIYNYYVNTYNDDILNSIFILIYDLLDKENTISNNKDFIKVFKKNDVILFALYYFYNKDIELLAIFYSILIYKSFSFKSYNKFEKSDIILHNAVNVLRNFFIYFENLNNLNIANFYDDLTTHIFPIFEFLIIYKIINTKILINRNNNLFKTEKFWTMKISIKKDYEWDFFINEPRIHKFSNNFYLVGGYYNKIYEIMKKNLNSGNIFEINDMQYIISILKNKWYIDIPWFEYIIKEIMIYNNTNSVELKKKLYEITNKLIENNWSNIEDQKKYSELNNINQIIEFYNILHYFKTIKYIYFPFFFDFRGRLYYYGNVSITSNKILRTIYYYGYYDVVEKFKNHNPIFLQLIKTFEKEILKIKKLFNIEKNDNNLNINIFLLLISIGKFLINKSEGKISLEEFINKSENYLENLNRKKMNSIEDEIEINHYIRILKNITFDDNKKYIVLKDFTASFFQHLTRLLGSKNYTTLLMCNMSSQHIWYDPYTIIINLFLENEKNDQFVIYFKRSYVKKVIMTIPYSIGLDSAWKYFTESLEDKYSNMNAQDRKNLRKKFNKFYFFVKKKIDGDYFFSNSTNKMILYAITKALIYNKIRIDLDISTADLIYFKKKTKRIDLIVKLDKEIRITKKINKIDENNIDIDNILQSLRANWIAVLDAESLKKINKKFEIPLFSIHDCILIDWKNIDQLITYSNEIMKSNNFDISWNNIINSDGFSIFIIL